MDSAGSDRDHVGTWLLYGVTQKESGSRVGLSNIDKKNIAIRIPQYQNVV